MEQPRTWRALLGEVIRDAQEKQRIADELGINPITLIRWAKGRSNPRLHSLRQLLNAMPLRRQMLLPLIAEEFEDILDASNTQSTDVVQEIPSAFYARVLTINTFTPSLLRASSIYTLILEQALAQLDPNKLGMSITMIRCIPPAAGHKVRSLRSGLGRGTAPWSSHLENQTLLLGAESLAGYSVASCRLVVNQNIHAGVSFFPVRWSEWEESVAACPLLRGNCVAGCMLVVSTQVDYFSPSRQALIQNYANLMAVACEPEDFYDLSHLELGLMPPVHVQRVYFTQFQQRITQAMIQASREGRPITSLQAETLVWQHLEEELLQEYLRLPVNTEG